MLRFLRRRPEGQAGPGALENCGNLRVPGLAREVDEVTAHRLDMGISPMLEQEEDHLLASPHRGRPERRVAVLALAVDALDIGSLIQKESGDFGIAGGVEKPVKVGTGFEQEPEGREIALGVEQGRVTVEALGVDRDCGGEELANKAPIALEGGLVKRGVASSPHLLALVVMELVDPGIGPGREQTLGDVVVAEPGRLDEGGLVDAVPRR